MGILSILLIGLVAGVIARLLMPGRDPIGIVGTIAVGVGGAFIGWWIGKSLVGGSGVLEHRFLWAILGAVLLLLLYRAISGRSRYRGLAGRWGRRW